MSKPELKGVAVGAGYFSQFQFDAWSRMEDVVLSAICDVNEDLAQTAAAKYGIANHYSDFAEMLDAEQPDFVDIITRPDSHLALVKEAAKRRIPIICQKALAPTFDEAKEIVQVADSASVPLMVHENFRFQPWYRRIKDLLDQGAIGQVYQASFRLRPGDGQGPDAYLARQPYFQQMPRFLVHETGIHWIDTFRYLLGEVTSISADLRQLNPAIAGEDAGVLQLAFANGTRAVFDGNRLADHAAQNRRLTMGEMEIDGSAGSLRLDGNGAIRLRAHDSNDWIEHHYDWNDHRFGGDCVYLTSKAILDAFREGRPAETEASAYLRNIELVEAAYQSHAERRWVDV